MKYFLVLTFSILSSLVFSQEGELKPIEVRMSYLNDTPTKSILLGSEIDIKFELSTELPIHFFQSLVNNRFLFGRAAYVSRAKELAVIRTGFAKIFSARAAFINPIVPQTNYKLQLEGLGVELQIINLNVEVMNDKALLEEISKTPKPKVLTQDYRDEMNYEKFLPILILILIILLIVFLYFWTRYKEKNFERIRKEKWKNYLSNASSRSELEKIYLLRKRWSDVLSVSEIKVRTFSQVMNKYQYQQSWTQDEMTLRKEALNKVLRNRGGE